VSVAPRAVVGSDREGSESVLRLTLQALKIGAIVITALLAVFFSQRFFTYYLDRSLTNETTSVLFEVGEEESTDSVADRLHQFGLIRSTPYFKGKIRLRADSQLKAGLYNLQGGMSVDEILDTITVTKNAAPAQGTPVGSGYVQFRTQEGWRMEQVAQLLVEKGLVKSQDEFIAAMSDPALNLGRYEFLTSRPSSAKLEGFLFPDTYVMPLNVPPKEIIGRMLQTFEQKVPQASRATLPPGYNFYQVLTVASIVEREAALDNERAIIASVYYNRIKQTPPLPLQADPTVQYAIGQEGNWWPQVQPTDLQRESPYNTYRQPGLPPGPICSPSAKSIQAALTPAPTEFLYFVATGDGGHAFARTYEEHLVNIQKYQR
jgi:UPF0755 protein